MNDYRKDPALRTMDGRVIRLPRSFDPVEAALVGNNRELPGGLVALYDPNSETGAVWIPAVGRWTMQQPVTREEFEASLIAGERIADKLAGTLH